MYYYTCKLHLKLGNLFKLFFNSLLLSFFFISEVSFRSLLSVLCRIQCNMLDARNVSTHTCNMLDAERFHVLLKKFGKGT